MSMRMKSRFKSVCAYVCVWTRRVEKKGRKEKPLTLKGLQGDGVDPDWIEICGGWPRYKCSGGCFRAMKRLKVKYITRERVAEESKGESRRANCEDREEL
jgi:hypothetical protein